MAANVSQGHNQVMCLAILTDDPCAANLNLFVYRDGHQVSRRSDLIIYSVEAAQIDQVVAMYGPCEFSFILVS